MKLRIITALLLLAAVTASWRPAPAWGQSSARLDDALSARLQALPAGQQVSVIVTLKDQADLRATGGRSRAERQKDVVAKLRQHAALTQARLLALLRQRQRQGSVASFKPLWVFNSILATLDPAVVDELARRPEVSQITLDATIAAPPRPSLAAAVAVEPNIAAINAPALWALGYQGQGVVVANMDTGVDNSHPDLAAQWRGGANSWYDPYGEHATPTDLNGHGTWTMGVMVGRDGGGTAVGVAPQAQWIAVKIFNDRGSATTSAIHQGFQWLLDPDNNPATADAPDVVNNSWDYSNVNGCDLTFEPDMESLAAAGIVSVFAAGNQGPTGSTSVSPANNPAAFAVGGVDNTGLTDSGSSRGPTSCGGATRTFPDLVAPDVAINTTDLYGLYIGATGTSLAAPHVAGGLALLLSAFPNLTADQQRAALVAGAVDLGAAGPDPVFGGGRIDLLASYSALASGSLPTATPAPPTSTPAPATDTPIPPTATATATSTATATATATSTATATATATSTATATATASGAIFVDGFDAGNLAAWSTTGGTASRIAASAGAAQAGGYKLQAQISGGASGYVQDNAPAAETSYHARFYLNPNGVTLSSSTPHTVFSAINQSGAKVLSVDLQRTSGGQYQIRASVARQSGTTTTNWYTVANGAYHWIEVGWQSGKSASVSLYIDSTTARQTLGGLNTSAYTIESTRLGPQGSLSGASGAEYFDTFASTRGSMIGP